VDAFAASSPTDRAAYFVEAEEQLGYSAVIAEKDFWVCWTLRHVFALKGQHRLIFKGGTSLSKCYRVIQRFSEDIDLAYHRDDLGFSGERDPALAPSRNKRQRLLDALSEKCAEVIAGSLLPALSVDCNQVLAGQQWSLDLDHDDSQTLLFSYPLSLRQSAYGNLAYVKPSLRLELGARSDHEPAEDLVVRPYVEDAMPGSIADPDCLVHALAAERTFWEKATLLHVEAHRVAPETRGAERWSRHYYDVVMLWRSDVRRRALARIDLLESVAHHKEIYFPSTWASYKTARRGSLRLVPGNDALALLRRDYEKMGELLFDSPPAWEVLLGELREIEQAINRSQ